MIARFRSLLTQIQTQYIHPLDRQRAYGLSLLNIVMLLAWLLGVIVFIALPLSRGETLLADDIFTFSVPPIVILANQRLIQNGRLRWATWLFVTMLTLLVMVLNWSGLDRTDPVLFVLPITAAGFLLSRREIVMLIGALLVVTLVSAFNQSQSSALLEYSPAAETIPNLVYVLLALVVASVLLVFFSGGAEKAIGELSKGVERLEDINGLHRQLERAASENDALLRTAELIVDRWLFTFSQIHLFDSVNELYCYRRTGLGTRHATVRSDHRQGTALAEVLASRNMLLVSRQDPPERHSHLQPSTTYGLLIPLVSENQTLGVLDVQSNRFESPFSDTERLLLRLVAGSLTAALVSVRTRTQLEQALREQETMNRRLQGQVADLKGTADRAGSEWRAYLHGRGKTSYGFDLQGEEMALVPATNFPDALRPALMSGETVVSTTTSGQEVNVPIRLRDETLGAMTFTLPKDHPVTDRQLEIANVVSQRLALALENARLVEQTQLLAQRERKAGEIGSMLIGQQDFDALLNVAAQNFGTALGAVYTHIYLDPEALVTAESEVSQDGGQ